MQIIMSRAGRNEARRISPLLVTDVERRLLRSCKTLRALPDREARFHVVRSHWPETKDDPDEAYGYTEETLPKFRPSPSDVSDFLIALSWIRGIPRREFNLVWWRSFGVSFKHIGIRIGRSDDTARARYKDVILGAWYAANKAS